MKDGDFVGYLGKMVIYPLNVWIARNVKWEWGHSKARPFTNPFLGITHRIFSMNGNI